MYDVSESVSVSYPDSTARKVSVSYLDTKSGEVCVSYLDTFKKYLWTPLTICIIHVTLNRVQHPLVVSIRQPSIPWINRYE